jgi:membrane associated rhomboid family serine protease
MRDAYHAPRATTVLIVTLIVLFVIQSVLFFYGDFNSFRFFGLTVSGLSEGKVWQLLTFQFMHSCPWPWHVLANCLGLYFFARPVEEMVGTKKFLALYFLSGFIGGLVQLLVTMGLPRHPDIPVVGASAGVFGMIAIFCSLHPMQELTTWIYFFPINIRAIYLLWFLGLLSLFGTIVPFDYLAHGAHLGGIMVGLAYVRWVHSSNGLAEWWAKRQPHRSRPMVKVRFRKSSSWAEESRVQPREGSAADFISKEVDPILDKISAHGIQSLTPRERQILEAARAKMEKR